MPRKSSGMPRVDIVNRVQKNGDIYVYEVTSKYNPAKRYNETISSKLLGKIPKGETEMVPTRPRKDPRKKVIEANRFNVGLTDILSWIGKTSGIDKDIYNAADKGTAQKILSLAWFWTSNKDRAIRHIEEWQIGHRIPYAEGLSEDTCYLLMKQLGTDIYEGIIRPIDEFFSGIYEWLKQHIMTRSLTDSRNCLELKQIPQRSWKVWAAT